MTTRTTKDLTIIGIGSSAGGLEAIRELVATLPVDVPAAYVVVQHMSPHHKSLMTELVARQTQLKVGTIENGTVPEANVVYITPPKAM
ncbi:chemotaxis protein CheB [Phaeobacter piscinae]|uniref:chemotaxis protein CheB n=1 Tax=Phaeobacter piscinae TaxID=1580596 RepID=UPI0039F6DE5E